MNSEVALIGAILVNNQVLDNLEIKPEHFEQHGDLFRCLKREIEKGSSVDTVSLAQVVEHLPIGIQYGLPELTQMVFDACSPTNATRHAEILREGYGKRLIRQVCISAVNQTQEGASFDETVNYITTCLLDMDLKNRTGAKELNDVLSSYCDLIQTRLDGNVEKVKTGVVGLDDILGGGFEPGQLVIVGGRPGMGKSAFSLGVAVNAEKPILIVNMEMANEQTAERFVANVGSAHLGWLRNPTEHSDNWNKLTYAIGRLAEKRNMIFLDDCPAQSVFSIRAEARRIQRKHGLGCVVVDYLSLLEGSDAKERHNQVAEFSRGLKKLAKELNVPIVALCQLSRSVEQRGDKKPTMSDLRESGQIEQDADIIIFLYRDDFYNKNSEYRGEAELIVAKQRQGGTGSVRCLYQGPYTRFDDLPEGYIPPEPEKAYSDAKSRSYG